ncbi:MAG: hypothetical protein AB1625_07990 [Acidobacteriota bacterium]
MKRAVVVGDGRIPVEVVLGVLTSAGFEAVTAGSVAEARAHVDAGAVAVVLGGGGVSWSAERARPLVSMPPSARRGCLLVLVADGLTTGSGMPALMHEVDLVIDGHDVPKLGQLVASGLLAKRALVAPLDPAAAARLGG